MSTIKLNANGACAIIAQMKTRRDKIETYYEDMATEVASLTADGYMEGDAAESYVSEFTEKMNPTIEAALGAIDACIAQIEALIEYMQQAEKDVFGKVFN